MTTSVIDGNYFIHRAFSVVASRKNLNNLERNILDAVLKSISSEAVKQKASHVLVCFDSKRSFRHDIYPDYKGNRNKGSTTEIKLFDGTTIDIGRTPGSFVKPMKVCLKLAGLATAHVNAREADDLMGSAANLPGRVILNTRDKDMAGLVNDRVWLWWPKEKLMIKREQVFKHYGVYPEHMRDYLCLLGDKVDNIPGVDGIGPKTAAKWLLEHGSIATMLKDPKIRAKLKPHFKTLAMAKKLVTLCPDVEFRLEDLVPQQINTDLKELVWQIPTDLKDLSDFRKSASLKGLFGKR
jgi:DNA polymerase-1